MSEEKSMQTREAGEVSKYDPELLNKAKSMSGEGGGTKISFIPRIRINNKSEKKMATVEGVEKEVKILPEAGFLVTKKNENNEYIESLFGPTLSCGVLKERYQIESGYEEEPAYLSDEFDSFFGIIKLHSRKDRKEVIAEGTYKELKEMFKTGEKNSAGKDKVSFGTSVILYISVGEDIYRFKWKLGMNNNWFDYKNSFGDNDTYVAYTTNFELNKDTKGDNDYWFATAKQGEPINLEEQMGKQMDIQKFFFVVDKVTSDYTSQPAMMPDEVIEVDEDQEIKDRIQAIPF